MNEKKEMMILADTIQGEINRMCVTDELSELDTMALHAKKNIEKLQGMRYSDIKEEIHREREQAYMQGYEDGRKRLIKLIQNSIEDGEDCVRLIELVEQI